MQLEAPAKINLSFRILGRRDDGFHAIETLMAPVSLCDTLTITRAGAGGGIKLVCDDPTLATGDDNLVVKAARLFLREARIDAGISLDLRKRIPHGAGLGGGSSDAAATLTGLNRMFDGRFSQDELQRVAAQLGSDVPFFIGGTAAKCSGRGEVVHPVSLGQALPLLLLKPGFGVSTPWAYSRWVESAELPGIDYAPQEFAEFSFVNDLERPVFERHPFLADLKSWLRRQPEVGVALMSGSGSTMFAVLREAGAAEVLAERARAALDPELWTCACKTCESSDQGRGAG